MKNGFVPVPRHLQESRIWQSKPVSEVQAYIDLMFMAAYRKHKVALNRELQRGQVWTTLRDLAKRWGWSKDKVARFIRRLKSEGMVHVESDRTRDTGGTLITIVDYDTGQAPKRDTACDGTETQKRQKPRHGARQSSHGETGSETRRKSRKKAGQNSDYQNKLNNNLFPCASGPSGGDGGKESKPSGRDIWAQWVDVNRERERADPAPLGPDLKAGKSLASLLQSQDIRRILEMFLDDGDAFLARQGHALRLLPGRINAYLNAQGEQEVAVSPEQMAATLPEEMPSDILDAYSQEGQQ